MYSYNYVLINYVNCFDIQTDFKYVCLRFANYVMACPPRKFCHLAKEGQKRKIVEILQIRVKLCPLFSFQCDHKIINR